MANHSVEVPREGIAALFMDPLQHDDPGQLRRLAEREAGELDDEMVALCNLLRLASAQTESQLDSETVAYAAGLQRRLIRLQSALRGLA